jgi:RND family efflux transporter MFP subunit
MRHRHLLPGLLGAALAVAAGCQNNKPPAPTSDQPAIPVAQPVSRQVADTVEFTGSTDAVESADLRARVTGQIVNIYFKDGSEVRMGDLLFEVDPRPYQAQLDQAESQVSLNNASYRLALSTLARAQEEQRKGGAVSEQDMDQYRAAVAEAAARLKASQASTEVYHLNLRYTRVTAPIDGQISRAYLTLGNLVNQDQTLLGTIVSQDPIRVYFEMDSRSYQRWLAAMRQSRSSSIGERGEGSPVRLALENEVGFPHVGVIDFVNNQYNRSTGSIAVRGVFANPRLPSDADVAEIAVTTLGMLATPGGAGPLLAVPAPLPGLSRFGWRLGSGPLRAVQAAGALGLATTPLQQGLFLALGDLSVDTRRRNPRLMKPGAFVRVQLPLGEPHPALLVKDRAVGSDLGQKQKYVYVIGPDGKIQRRNVVTGALLEDGLRVVEGLRPDDWVLVGGTQLVKEGDTVTPERRDMVTGALLAQPKP